MLSFPFSKRKMKVWYKRKSITFILFSTAKKSICTINMSLIQLNLRKQIPIIPRNGAGLDRGETEGPPLSSSRVRLYHGADAGLTQDIGCILLGGRDQAFKGLIEDNPRKLAGPNNDCQLRAPLFTSLLVESSLCAEKLVRVATCMPPRSSFLFQVLEPVAGAS